MDISGHGPVKKSKSKILIIIIIITILIVSYIGLLIYRADTGPSDLSIPKKFLSLNVFLGKSMNACRRLDVMRT